MFATLPMYDFPALRFATNTWWSGLARALTDEGFTDVPSTLTRAPDLSEQWLAPTLLLAQTCGYPLTMCLRSRVRLVALPCYAAVGCEGGMYRSAIIVRRNDEAQSLAEMRGRRAVLNSSMSHSGMNVLRAMVAELAAGEPFFSKVSISGSHARSIEMVHNGDSDLAAIDCVSLTLLGDIDPKLMQGIRILQLSPRAPGLPYITSATMSDEEVARMRRALRRAVEDPSLARVRAQLRIFDFEIPSENDYTVIQTMHYRAHRLDYPHVC